MEASVWILNKQQYGCQIWIRIMCSHRTVKNSKLEQSEINLKASFHLQWCDTQII